MADCNHQIPTALGYCRKCMNEPRDHNAPELALLETILEEVDEHGLDVVAITKGDATHAALQLARGVTWLLIFGGGELKVAGRTYRLETIK